MALLISRFVPSMEVSWGPKQQPQFIRHRARGGLLLLPHGEYYRRPADNGVFVASSSAATTTRRSVISSSSVSAWWPAAKNLQQLQHRFAAPAQERRVFCSLGDYCSEEDDPGHDIGGSPAAIDPENSWKTYAKAKHQLEAALARNNNSNIDGQQVLENLRTLACFAKDRGYYAKEYKAKQLLQTAVVLPLSKDLHRHGRLHDVVRKSLELARLLLKNAPEPIAKKLRSELRPVLHKIIRDCGGGHHKTADELRELRELARSVLQAQELPPT